MDALKGRKDLKVLHLSENLIGQVGCDSLADFLEETMLKELDLSRAEVSDDQIAPIASQIEVHPKLCVLNLSKNKIGSKGGELIGQMIANRGCCLTYVTG